MKLPKIHLSRITFFAATSAGENGKKPRSTEDHILWSKSRLEMRINILMLIIAKPFQPGSLGMILGVSR
jgi:hypothetical protein